MPPEWRRRALLGLGLLVVVLVYVWPITLHPNDIAFLPGSRFTDLLVSHLPNAAYLRDSLWQQGQVPWWNAPLFTGQPFAADPLAGLWYPPFWLLLFVPLALGFNLLFVLHLTWGGLGVYALARSEGVDTAAAWLAAMLFAGTPKLVAHLAAGHVSLIFAVAWTPWLLVNVRRAVAAPTWQRGAWAGATLALISLADVRWAYFSGVLAVAFALAETLRLRPQWRRGLLALVGACALFPLLCAPLALPLAEFVGLSRRAGLTVGDAGVYSLPPQYLLGILLTPLNSFHEYATYLGPVGLLLALAGLRRKTLFWAVAALVTALFALGTYTFFYPLLFRFVPGISLLRVPPRAWFIVCLCACLLAAHGADRLLREWLPRLNNRPGAIVPLPGPRAALVGLLLLGGLDLLRVDSTVLETRPHPPTTAAATWLAQQPGLFRVYSPSYSLPPGDSLNHLDGVDPLQLAAPAAAIEQATGIAAEGYGVIVPPFTTGDLAHEHENALPNADLLGRLNVRYVASEFPITTAGFELAQRFDTTYVYVNTAWRERAWLDDSDGDVALESWSPNQLVVTAIGPGRLVISESAYPGWQATVDDAPAALQSTVDGLLALDLPAGQHHVVVEFVPTLVYLGLAAAVIGLLVLIAGAWLPRLAARRG